MWMEQTALALGQMTDPSDVYYAFPAPLAVPATHIYWKEPFRHRVLRAVTKATGHPIHVRQCWAELDSLTRRYRIDRVLLMLGDPFLHPAYVPHPSCEWVPIYFHPSHLRGSGAISPDRSLASPSCPFIYVLDDAMREPLSRAVGKPVLKMPDFFEPSRSGPTNRTNHLLSNAGGRPIICAIGPITPHKGVASLLQIALKRPDWHILIVGTVQSLRHRKEDLRFLEQASSMKNVTWFRERIDHAELNELTALSRVHYAVYKQFLHSSNKLIRACENRRPLVVSKEGYMAEMVTVHKIGCTCDAASLSSIEEAIATAIESDLSTADWFGYERVNSLARLPDALRAFATPGAPA